MIDIQALGAMYKERRDSLAPELSRWREVARNYEGKVVVPMPELDETEKSLAVNLLGPGLDQLAMRIASTMPDIACDALRPGFKNSENMADTKRKALLSYWDMNRMDMVMRRRARYLLGYAAAPVSLSPVALNPQDKREIPHWRVLNPMCVFPAPSNNPLDIEPTDTIMAYLQPYSWLVQKYPTLAQVIRRPRNCSSDTKFEILEYNDAEETVLVALGQEGNQQESFSWTPGASDTLGSQSVVELERTVNRAEIPLTVYPGRISLSGIQGMFDQLMPVFYNASKLASLEFIAIKRSIFADQYLVTHPGSPGQAQLITRADGLTGVMGEIRNGQIQETQTQPSIQAAQMQDRLERVGRLAGGLPAELGGESATNIRTAKRGEAVLGSAIDMPVQEHQEIFEDSLEAENRRAIAVMKSHYGSKPTSFYIPRNGKVTQEDYVPNEVFVNDQNVVKYAMAGTDINSFVVGALQRVQAQTMSAETFMRMDPYIEDYQEEISRVYLEGTRRALLASIEQAAQQGTFASDNIAELARAMRDGSTLIEDAVTEVHKKMQKDQAAQQPGPPAQQPGLGAAMQGGQGAIPNPPPSQQAVSQILANLHSPAGNPGYQAPPQQSAMAQ